MLDDLAHKHTNGDCSDHGQINIFEKYQLLQKIGAKVFLERKRHSLSSDIDFKNKTISTKTFNFIGFSKFTLR